MNNKRIFLSGAMATIMLVAVLGVAVSSAAADGLALYISPGVSNAWTSTNTNYIFAVGPSSAVSYEPVGGSSWTSLGGAVTASPAAVSWNGNNRMDVVVRGTDGVVWHKFTNNGGSTWSNWESLGGQLAANTGPTICSWGNNRLDIFVAGTDNAMWHKWWNGSKWSGWENLGGTLASAPTAAAGGTRGAYLIEVAVAGTNGAVWQKQYSNGWSGWRSLGGQVKATTGPAVSSTYRLFVQGTDGNLWRNDLSSAWLSCGKPAEGIVAASPAASLTFGALSSVVCVLGTSGNIWYSQDSPSWSTWTSAGAPT